MSADARPTAGSSPPDGPRRAVDVEEDGTGSSRFRRELRAFLELFTLNGFAIAQPILDVFGQAPDQFVFRGADRGDVIAFGVIVTFALPVLLWVLEAAVDLVSERARGLLHRGALVAFATVFLVIVTDSAVGRVLAIGLGIVGAALLVIAYDRTRGPRLWLAFASPAPVAFLVIFLLFSQVTSLLRTPPSAHALDVGSPAPTVVVLFDEFPLGSLITAEGEIDADLYPNFARLAKASTWFRNTTSVATATSLAVPAIVTGQLPDGPAVATSADHPDNLFTLVGDSMPITSSEAVTSLCPESICDRIVPDTNSLPALLGDARGVLASWLDPSDPTVDPLIGQFEDDADPGLAEGEGDGAFSASSRNGRFEEFLDRIGGPDPSLSYIHLLLPHMPHRILPDGTVYKTPASEPGRFVDVWHSDEEPIEVARTRHLLQAQWTDAVLGRVLDRLEDAGTFDATNLVVVADHGLSFEPGQPMRMASESATGDEEALAQIMAVPLLVKAAGQTHGEVSDAPVRTVDVLPTIADLLDVEIPWETDGRSVYEGGSGDDDSATITLGRGWPGTIEPGITRTVDRGFIWDVLLERSTTAFAPLDTSGANGSARLFRRGPNPELWGRAAPEDLGDELSFEPIGASPTDLDLPAGVVPAFFHARVTGAEPGSAVAVVIDGTVWATTTTYGPEDDVQVVVVLPVEAFADGVQQLSLVTIA